MLTTITHSAYGIGIEYQPDPTNNEISRDDNMLTDILVNPGPVIIPDDEKTEFLKTYLKITDNMPSELYTNNSLEPEKGDSMLLWEQKNIPEENLKPDKNSMLALKEKHGSEKSDKKLSAKMRIDWIQQDDKPVNDIFGYSIQVNSYKQKTNAYDLIKQLKKQNYESYFSEVYNPLTKETYYRVFVGKYYDLQSAEKTCELLKKKKEFTDNIFVVDKKWVKGK